MNCELYVQKRYLYIYVTNYYRAYEIEITTYIIQYYLSKQKESIPILLSRLKKHENFTRIYSS